MAGEKTWRLVDLEFVRDRRQSERLGYDIFKQGYFKGTKDGKEVWTIREDEARLFEREEALRVLVWWRAKHGNKNTVTVG